MATITRRQAAVDQILLVVFPFAVWLALSDRLFRSPVATFASGPLLHVAATAIVAAALIAVALASEVDRLRALGLGPMRASAALGWGSLAAAACYVASSTAALVYLVVTQRQPADELASKAEWTARLAHVPVGWIVPLAILVGVYEEVLFRGFLLGRLRVALCALGPRAADAIAVLASAALFGSGHAYQGGLGVVQTATMGVVLGIVTVRCGVVWPAIVAHVIVDTLGLFVLHAIEPALPP